MSASETFIVTRILHFCLYSMCLCVHHAHVHFGSKAQHVVVTHSYVHITSAILHVFIYMQNNIIQMVST